MKKIISIFIVLILLMLSGCSTQSEKTNPYYVDYDNPDSVYTVAQEMYNKRDIYNAKILFDYIPDYKDSKIYLDKLNCVIELIGDYSLWSDGDIKVYVTEKSLGIVGKSEKYYSDYEVVEFHTNYASSNDLCIYYPEYSSSSGEGMLLIKSSEHISLWKVNGYDETYKEYILDDFNWLVSENE